METQDGRALTGLDYTEFYRLRDDEEAFPHRVELLRGVPTRRAVRTWATVARIHLFLSAARTWELAGGFTYTGPSIETVEMSAPVPDLVVLPDDPHMAYLGMAEATAKEAKLVVDVDLREHSDLRHHLYASAGIPEFWIVRDDLRAVEVLRSPEQGRYQERMLVPESDFLAPLFAPELPVGVSSLHQRSRTIADAG